MKRLFALSLIASVIAILPTEAQDKKADSKIAAIEELFKVTKQKEQYEVAVIAGFEAGIASTVTTVPADLKPKMERGMEKVKQLMLKEMGWDNVKSDMGELYAVRFSEKEIRALIPIFSKPKLQSCIAKQIKLLPVAVKLGQEKAVALQPRIMQIMAAEMAP